MAGQYANIVRGRPASIKTVSSEAVERSCARALRCNWQAGRSPGPVSLSFSPTLDGGADAPVLHAVQLVCRKTVQFAAAEMKYKVRVPFT